MAFCALTPSLIYGQLPSTRTTTTNYNGWYMYYGNHEVADRWSVYFEAQARRNDVVTKWQQYLFRPALNYQVNNKLIVSGGYAFIDTFRYGQFPVAARFPENRIYQQAAIAHDTKRVALQQRIRFEERWIGVMAPDPSGGSSVASWRYQNRFRYLLRANIALAGRWYLGVYDEIFLNVPPNIGASAYDQNRLYGAIGYNFTAPVRLELGYMNQALLQRNGLVLENNNTLQFAIYSTASFRRKKNHVK
ncbi:MAG: DUF2490 domain-containing protein [Bryobacteraceae bacterium]